MYRDGIAPAAVELGKEALPTYEPLGSSKGSIRCLKRWRNAAMALRWTAAGMMEAAKGFRRLKAYKQLPTPELDRLIYRH
jgi:hypothetical protein